MGSIFIGKVKAMWSLLWARDWWLSTSKGTPPTRYLHTYWYMTNEAVRAVSTSATRVADEEEAEDQAGFLINTCSGRTHGS